MARRRGGSRTPSNPAAVSGPGALSQRTDGAVPKTLPVGGDYGDRKALAEQQSAAPMTPQRAAGGGVTPGAAAGRGTGRVGGQFGPRRVFSPTNRPGEPLTAGVDWGPGPGRPARDDLATDPFLLVRAMHQQNPTPQLARLLARLASHRA